MSGNSQIDPITAIRAYAASLNDAGRQALEKELGMSLDSVGLMNYEVAKEFCKSHDINLGETNVWSRYNNAKADWEANYDAYQQANSIYVKMKAEMNRAKKKYEVKYNEALAKNKGQQLNSVQINQIRQETKYTTEVIKNVHDAEFTAANFLDKMNSAVDAQRAGLAFGIVAEKGMDFKA